MAGRLTGDQNAEGIRPFIGGLMLLAGRNFDAFPFFENKLVILDLHGQFAFEDIKKLAGLDVEMAAFAGRRGHKFFDHAELRGFHQVPAVAGASPVVVFGGFYAGYRGGHV